MVGGCDGKPLRSDPLHVEIDSQPPDAGRFVSQPPIWGNLTSPQSAAWGRRCTSPRAHVSLCRLGRGQSVNRTF